MARARVDPGAGGQRVDHLIAATVPGLSVAAARRLVASGGVRVAGRRVHKGERLVADQIVEIDDALLAGLLRPPTVLPDPDLAGVTVIFLDDTLVAIAKPAGVPSHPLRPLQLGTAANAIVARFPGCATASPDPREAGLVHRLDTATSGVLVAARDAAVWPRLRAAFTHDDCEKTYLAEVVGMAPDSGAATGPIGRVGRRAGRVRVGGGRRPLPARSDWEVLERRKDSTLLRVRLHAGRAHQVRAHLAAAGFPIVGDPKYGATDAGWLHLHAAAVRFRHPISGEMKLIEAPSPEWAMLRP